MITRSESHMNLVSDCRDRSQAAWLHFPHIELLFLVFAFEGAVASEVAALRDSRCPWVTIAAATTLVSPRLCRGYANFACLQYSNKAGRVSKKSRFLRELLSTFK